MTFPPFCNNKVAWFWTSYNQGKDKNLVGLRCYFLFSVDKDKKLFKFFPITSNRTRFIVYISQYKVPDPRPVCLKSKFYLESFINTNLLVNIPFEAIPHLSFCRKCSSPVCLKEEYFETITRLHSNLPNYGKKIDKADLTIEDFKKV